ncbi:MAG: PKD domain-containing protein, partial [Bacteroidota bacterium]
MVTSWLWDFDADGQFDDASGKTVQFTFGQPAAFPVRLKVITTTGSDSMATPKDVIVHPLPDVNFRVDNLCEGETGLYQDQSSISSGAITQYNWDFDNNGVVDDNSGPVVSFTNGPPATFVTRLNCVSDQGCSAFTEKTTEVFPLPQAAFSTGPVCVGVPTFLDNISLSDDPVLFYRWDFGDGQELIDSGDVNHVFDTVQDFEVTLIAVSDNNCRDTTSQTVTVNPLPDDSLELSGDSALVEGTTLTISVVGASNIFSWSTGSNTSSITVSEAGNYAVTFTDANDCSASRSAQVTVIPSDAPVRIANNVLTPNGDGINDFLL